jgi:5-methylcytosine-specific restriction endonuclease McrA
MQTLVLNTGYEPLGQTSFRRALNLVFRSKVEVLEVYEEQEIHTVSLTIKAPAVVRFLNRVQGHHRSLRYSKSNVYARDYGRCAYCRTRVFFKEATLDHVVPRHLGGKTRWENIVLCCFSCNQKKGGRTPEGANMRLLFKPYVPTGPVVAYRMILSLRSSIPPYWIPYVESFSIDPILPKSA